MDAYRITTMNRPLLAIAVWIVAASCAFAAAPDTGGPGWKALFKPDYSDAEKPDGVWSVADGALTASADQCIWTKTEHADFLLELEFKNAAGTNSGVILYCTDPNNWIPKSVEIQIADDFAEKWAKSPATWHCGAVFGHVAPTAGLVKPPGEWNKMTDRSPWPAPQGLAQRHAGLGNGHGQVDLGQNQSRTAPRFRRGSARRWPRCRPKAASASKANTAMPPSGSATSASSRSRNKRLAIS